MSKSKRSRFCVAPFVALNTRGYGNARICCSISGLNRGIPKNKNMAEANQSSGPDMRGYDPDAEYYNLTKDPVEEMWNGTYYRDIRKKMFGNEDIINCKFCYQLEDSGLWSKRMGRNHLFLGDPEGDFDNVQSKNPLHQETADYLKRVRQNDGVSDQLPQWLEIRFSTVCNLRCVMCSPTLSTAIYKEFEDHFDEISWKMRGALRVAKQLSEPGQLRDSEYFMNQIKKLAASSRFFEFRGGEVLQDKELLAFINELSYSENASNIQLDLTTNGIGLNPKHIAMFNRFGGGNLKMSIDAYGELNEFIRYPSKWPVTVRGLEQLAGLHKGWKKTVQATLTVFQATSIHKLLHFLDDIAKSKIKELVINMTMVRENDHLSHNMVGLSERILEAERVHQFILNSFMCSEKNPLGKKNTIALRGLETSLREPQSINYDKLSALKTQLEVYKKIRKQDPFSVCPHVKELMVQYEREKRVKESLKQGEPTQ